MPKPTFEEITKTAIAPLRHWSYRDRVRFHYFNPRGLYAEQKALDRRIDVLVAAKAVKSGWILAYGGMNDFQYKGMVELHDKKRVGRIEYQTWESMYRERNARVLEKIVEAEDALIERSIANYKASEQLVEDLGGVAA